MIGNFDSQAYGHDALKWLCNFEPDGYKWEPIECDTDIFQLVLQGPSLGIAMKSWVETLRWPQNLDQKDANDWGISWFERIISFYLFSGKLFEFNSCVWIRCTFQVPHTKRSGAQHA